MRYNIGGKATAGQSMARADWLACLLERQDPIRAAECARAACARRTSWRAGLER
jgi:hypothetical protein